MAPLMAILKVVSWPILWFVNRYGASLIRRVFMDLAMGTGTAEQEIRSVSSKLRLLERLELEQLQDSGAAPPVSDGHSVSLGPYVAHRNVQKLLIGAEKVAKSPFTFLWELDPAIEEFGPSSGATKR